LRGLIKELVSFCKPAAHDIGESKNLELARQVLIDEPGYSRQLKIYAESHSTHAVAEDLKNQLLIEEQQLISAA
jgi:gamma-glutamyl:cysteine ligase YbdK (ATP-grasp superfamily)